MANDLLSHVPTPADDSRILSLFREWIEACRAYGRAARAEEEDSAEEDKLYARSEEIRGTMAATPSAGVEGLSIKAYLAHDGLA
jgi:hypothetical protein